MPRAQVQSLVVEIRAHKLCGVATKKKIHPSPTICMDDGTHPPPPHVHTHTPHTSDATHLHTHMHRWWCSPSHPPIPGYMTFTTPHTDEAIHSTHTWVHGNIFTQYKENSMKSSPPVLSSLPQWHCCPQSPVAPSR